jgi:hypothetical protein
MKIELIRAWPRRFDRMEVELPAGACLEDALAASGWLPDATITGYAIFGQRAGPETPLHEGDRVELLRALEADPKEARRRRAELSKQEPSR